MAQRSRPTQELRAESPGVRVPTDHLWTRRSLITSIAAGLAVPRWTHSLPTQESAGSTVSRCGGGTVAFVSDWPDQARDGSTDPALLLDQVFARIRLAGMAGIDLVDGAFLRKDDVLRIGALARKHCVPIVGVVFAHIGCDRVADATAALSRAQSVLAHLTGLGGRSATVRLRRSSLPRTAAQFDAEAEMLREMLALSRAHDIALSLWTGTSELDHREYGMRNIVTRVPSLKLAADLDCLALTGTNPFDFIGRYAPRVSSVHWRDSDDNNFEVGEPAGSYGASHSLRRELGRIGFIGRVVIERASRRWLEPSQRSREQPPSTRTA